MKILQPFLGIVVASFLAATALAAAPEIQSLLTEGQTAYLRGDLEKAKAAFEMVYRMDSRNQVAIGYLRRIKVDEQNKPKGNDQEKQLAGVIIPQIQFRDATLGSALDYLKKAVEKQSDGQQAVNFVVQLPAEQVNTQTVTLNLTNIPFTEALRYLAESVNATVEYERYAIRVRPKSSAPPAVTGPRAQ